MQFWYNGHAIERLGQRYRLDGHLGSGGMAEVCLAWDEREMRRVAIKILKADDLDQESLNRFMKEAAQIVHWRHSHILRVYDTMQIELLDAPHGLLLFYFVMEYASGGDLHKRLVPGSPFPLSASFALFRQLCDAVQYAHEHGVIHRDLKPLNILFRRPASGPEEVVLSDFGLAVQADASHYTFARGGTLAYMAPEQFAGEISPACDIFALGVIIYQLCTGRLPFRRLLQDLPGVDSAPPPARPSRLNPDFPPELDAPILRALRGLPSERYPSVRAFWQAIEQVLTGVAQTYPYLSRESWLQTGQTWPFTSQPRSGERPALKHAPATNSLSFTPDRREAGPVESNGAWTEEPEAQMADAGGIWNDELEADALEAGELWEDEPEGTGRETPSRVPRRASALGPQDRPRAENSQPGIIAFQLSPGSRYATRGSDTDPRTTRLASATGRVERQRAASARAARSARPRALRATDVAGEHAPRRRIARPLALAFLALLLAGVLLATILPGSPLRLFGASPTIVTVTPQSRLEQNTYAFTAVTANPDPAARQVPARLLSATTPAQSATVNATGSLPASRATGQLTFINNGSADITIVPATITGKSGVSVSFNTTVTVPAAPPSIAVVNAFAVNSGVKGNIPVLDIVESCCAPNIVVKNTTAFTGGHDAETIVQQSDIDNAAHQLSGVLRPGAQASLREQVRSNERVVDGSLNCQPSVSADHRAGEVARAVTVTVTLACGEEVYDYQALVNAAGNLLRAQAASDANLGRAYAPSGPFAINILSMTVVNAQGQADIQVQARGLWAYTFSSDLLRHLAAQLAGKTKAQALAILARQPGIAAVHFSSDNPLPSSADQIQIVIGPPAG